MFNVIRVQFPTDISDSDYSSKQYNYLTDLADLKEDDLVVVDTQYGMRVAKVSCLYGNESQANKWIVCAIDHEAFRNKLDELKRKQFILKQVKQRVESQGFLAQAALMAESDPVLKKLLASIGDSNSLPEAPTVDPIDTSFDDDKDVEI